VFNCHFSFFCKCYFWNFYFLVYIICFVYFVHVLPLLVFKLHHKWHSVLRYTTRLKQWLSLPLHRDCRDCFRMEELFFCRSTPRELNWLSIQWRMKLKLGSLAFKDMHTDTQSYLSRLLVPYHRSCPWASFSVNLSQVHRINLTFGSRSFRAAVPTICNSLPDSIHSCDTFNSFLRHLKRIFSKQPSTSPSGKLQRCTWFTWPMALYKWFLPRVAMHPRY